MYKVDTYNTGAGKILPVDKIKTKLKEYLILNANNSIFNHILMPMKTIFISGLVSGDNDIPMFNLPILLDDTSGKQVMVIDIRRILKAKVTEEEIRKSSIRDVIKNEAEYCSTIVRAYLMQESLLNETLSFNNIKDDLTNSFALWVSAVAENNYFLTPEETITLRISLMYYYYALLSPSDITIANIKRIAVAISKYFGAVIDQRYVEKILEPLTSEFDKMNPKTINDLALTIQTCVSPYTDKLKNLNSISLTQMLLTSWYGDNSNETISISLEHPPTFAGICYLALNNNSFRVTKISNVLNSKLKNKKDFAINLNTILRNSNYR